MEIKKKERKERKQKGEKFKQENPKEGKTLPVDFPKGILTDKEDCQL